MVSSLQETYAPRSVCYGCGPENRRGLQIKSFVHGTEVLAEWEASEFHHAFGGILNGGIIGTLLDCNSNWAATVSLMRETDTESPPPTVTAEFQVRFLKPTPIGTVHLAARVVEQKGNRAVVEAELAVSSQVTATFRGTFVAVGKGHPAYERWAQ